MHKQLILLLQYLPVIKNLIQVKEQKKYSCSLRQPFLIILNEELCGPIVGVPIKKFVGALQSEIWIEATPTNYCQVLSATFDD